MTRGERGEYYHQCVRKRRKGVQVGSQRLDAHRLVDAITLEGAYQLLKDISADSKRLGEKIVAFGGADTIIKRIQTGTKQLFWQHKLQANLSKAAIDAFLSPTSPPISTDPAEPPALDDSYALSRYGGGWRAKGACNTEDLDLFFSKIPRVVAAAKKICAGCVVKGDCLLFALNQPQDEETASEGIFGGFTLEERQQMGEEVIKWLEQSKHPKDTGN